MRRVAALQLVLFALLAGTARAEGPVLGFSVASSAAVQSPVSLPSAGTPNQPGRISVPVSFTVPPASPEQLGVDQLHVLWSQAGAAYGIPWQVLAAINKIESNFGQNMGPSSAGAIGWMQFMPSTWLRWGVDADGDGIANPWVASDAIYSAARYLAAAGGQTDISRGVFAYNHADWYVNEVLSLAQVYGQSGPAETAELERLQAALESARTEVVVANQGLVAVQAKVRAMGVVSRKLQARVRSMDILSDRLVAERRAVLYDARIQGLRDVAAEARVTVAEAEQGLDAARQSARAPSFASGTGALLGSPAFESDYVFPVGGGPQVVSVSHTHHDYPAADIAAPSGAPVYALGASTVVRAWHMPDERCGIGLTLQTRDGLEWTYCHLSYLEAGIQTGSALAAGAPVGLVGSTGHATGPHLHLQLHPATAWPQEQPWFQRFAGTAFRWQDAPTPLDSITGSEQVFSVVPADGEPVIGFTR